MKKAISLILCAVLLVSVLSAAAFAADKPVKLKFVWYEPNSRKDCDNVSFAKKFILDALVEAGVLENDDPRHVGNFADYFKVNRDDPRVIVVLEAS